MRKKNKIVVVVLSPDVVLAVSGLTIFVVE
jgi:hypothetical protein